MTFMFETAGSLVFPDEWKVFWVGGGCILFFKLSASTSTNAAQSPVNEFFLHSRYGDGIERPKLHIFLLLFPFPTVLASSDQDRGQALRGPFLLPWVFLSGLLFLFSKYQEGKLS
jgi:hypothetical protein